MPSSLNQIVLSRLGLLSQGTSVGSWYGSRIKFMNFSRAPGISRFSSNSNVF